MSLPLDAETLRKDFPVFDTLAHGKRLVYLDSAATSQKPHQVIDRMVRFYESENANVHRGIYELAERATIAYEAARSVCAFYRRPQPPLDRFHPRDHRSDQPRAVHLGARQYP